MHKNIFIAALLLLISATPALGATVLFPSSGGTGTSTAPTYGQVLVGNPNGTYTLTATSSLGISGGSGGSGGVGTSTEPFMAKYFVATSTSQASFFPYASTTALSAADIYGSNLTAGRLVYATTSGQLATNAALTYDGTTFTSTGKTTLTGSAATGMVGVGVGPQANTLMYLQNGGGEALTSGTRSGYTSVITNNPASASNASIRGGTFSPAWVGTANSPSGILQGLSLSVSASPGLAGVLGRADGVGMLAFNNSLGTVTTLTGGRFDLSNQGGGFVTTARAGSFSLTNNNFSTTTNAYMMYAVVPTISSGQVTNLYGLYLENMTGAATLNYAIYSAGGQSYHAGNFGIATTTPFSPLSVSASAQGSPTAPLFTVASTTNATLLTVLGNGNVGIGTTSPAGLLNALTGVAEMRFSSGNAAATPTLAVINTGATGKAAALAAGTGGAVFSFDSAGFFAILGEAKTAFTSNAIGLGNYFFRVNGDGKVGVGTNYTPVQLFDVNAQFVVNGSNGNVGIASTSPTNKLSMTVTADGQGISIDSSGTLIATLARTSIAGTVSTALDGVTSRPISINNAASSNVLLAFGGGNVGIGTTTPSDRFTLNGNARLENQGQLKFSELRTNGNQSATLSATSSMAANVNWTLPDADGTNGQVLTTNGAGNWYWSTVGGTGTVTSVDMTVPTGLSISGNPVTTSGTLALTYAAGYAGVLTASTTNWNTFYDTPSNRISDGTGLTWSGNTLNCDTASGSVQGCLSSADWTTFNNKGSGTVTAVSVASANGFAGSSSGGATPALTLSTTATGLLQGNGTAITGISGTAGQFPYYNGTNTLLATSTLFLAASGFTGISTTTPYKLFSIGGDTVIGASVAGGTLGDLYLPKLTAAAGAFLAIDSAGKIIATTTPTSGNSITRGYATSTVPGVPKIISFSVVAGDTIEWWVSTNATGCNGAGATIVLALLKQSTYSATSTISTTKNNGGGAVTECSASTFAAFTATTTENINVAVDVTSVGGLAQTFSILANKIH